MRSCEDIEILINLCLDDMLPSEEIRPLKEHLQECQACREHFLQLRAMKDALGQLEEPVPEGLHGRILDYVEKNGPESAHTVSAEPVVFRPRRWLRRLTAVAACALVAVVAIRFVPDLVPAAPESIPESDLFYSAMKDVVSAMPPAANNATEESVTAPPQSESSTQKNQSITTPQQPEPPALPPEPGPLAEDLPPMRWDDKHTDESFSVRKWFSVQGDLANLPDWAAGELKQFTGEEGSTYPYAVIDHWNEDYWKDQLTPCGFVFTELTGHELQPDGDKILLFFFE